MESRRRFSRRRARRFEVNWPAQWTHDGTSYEGLVRDTTGAGLFLQPNEASAAIPNAGDSIELRLTVPDYGPLETTGIVTWSGESRIHGCAGFGIKFFNRHAEIDSQTRGRALRDRRKTDSSEKD